MKQTQVDEMVETRDKLGSIIKGLEPEYDAEWEALEKLTAAHKTLRGIDCAELRQLSMPLK